LGVVGVAAFLGYQYLFVSVEEKAALKIESAAADASSRAGQDFLAALINLQHVNLDAAAMVLSDESFVRLKDTSFSLPDEPRGRTNPFRQIGDEQSSGRETTGGTATGSSGI